MLETKQQKKYFTTTVVLIIILSLVTFWNRGNFSIRSGVPVNTKPAFDYDAYLASLKVDPVASSKLFEKLYSEEDIQRMVEEDLKINQTVILPTVSDTKIAISSDQGQTAVVNYFRTVGNILSEFQDKTLGASVAFFDQNASKEDLKTLQQSTSLAAKNIYSTPVPKEAVAYHKAQLGSLESYNGLIKTSADFVDRSKHDPWPLAYQGYTAINEQMVVLNREYDRLNLKYSINEALESEYAALSKNSNPFIKTVHAQFAVVDVKELARNIYEEAIAVIFAKFALTFLDKLIDTIEKNYKIANFLYYTDALVSGQYVDDYINKYSQKLSSVEKQMIKNFIPQLNCGTPQDLKLAMRAKASQYVGFDPATLDVNDPQYYQKLSRVGNFLATPEGWELYYQDIALQAQSEAEKAAQQELVAQGFKSARDAANKGNIATAGVTALTTFRSAFQSYLDLGTNNTRSAVGKFVSAAIQTTYNKYLFKGAVLKEQELCLAAAQITPVLPGGFVVPEPTPPEPNTKVVPSASGVYQQQ
jgi:hypothetical protein